MKTILQILYIVLFFILIGFALTYPYELSYHGDDEIILLEDSYESSSLEELINRPEFKNNVLYIKIWEPFEQDVLNYSEKELEKFRHKMDSLKGSPASDDYKRFSLLAGGRVIKKVFSIEEQLIFHTKMQ
jgi:hypothetical protein